MRYERIRDTRLSRDGYDLEQSITRLVNYHHLLREMVHLHCGWLPRMEPYDVKCLFGIHIQEDAIFVSRVDERLRELLEPGAVPFAPGMQMQEVLQFLRNLETWEEYAAAIYSVLKPALIDAWETHFTATDPLLDEPTARLLAKLLRVTSQHINGGMALIETILGERDSDRPGRVHAATRRMRDLWEGIGRDPLLCPQRINEHGKLHSRPPIERPSRDPFLKVLPEREPATAEEMQRPQSVETWIPTQPQAMKQFLHKLLDSKLTHAEICAITIHEHPELPWSFLELMARQIWDNVRHARILEKLLAEAGANWGDFPVDFPQFKYIAGAAIPERLRAIHRHGDRRAAWRKSQRRQVMIDQGQRRIARVFDYLLADEASHTAFGQRWIKELEKAPSNSTVSEAKNPR